MTRDKFIKEFHTQKVLKFEPPTWEEFLKTKDVSNHIYAHWDCGDISVFMAEGSIKEFNEFVIDNRDNCKFIQYSFDNRGDCYYKALEIAKEQFLGENDDK